MRQDVRRLKSEEGGEGEEQGEEAAGSRDVKLVGNLSAMGARCHGANPRTPMWSNGRNACR